MRSHAGHSQHLDIGTKRGSAFFGIQGLASFWIERDMNAKHGNTSFNQRRLK
jgi:hypothetical protein